jgi:hypothetical protein
MKMAVAVGMASVHVTAERQSYAFSSGCKSLKDKKDRFKILS